MAEMGIVLSVSKDIPEKLVLHESIFASQISLALEQIDFPAKTLAVIYFVNRQFFSGDSISVL
jgi:hypothetical protein